MPRVSGAPQGLLDSLGLGAMFLYRASVNHYGGFGDLAVAERSASIDDGRRPTRVWRALKDQRFGSKNRKNRSGVQVGL